MAASWGLWRTEQLLLFIVHFPVFWKAALIMTTVLLLSILDALELSPHCPVLADKNNVANGLLVKWSWGWTLLCLVPTVLLTASGLEWRQLSSHLSRLAVAHCVWLVVTSAFVALDSAVGQCSVGLVRSRRECVRLRGNWEGLDISGHVFLLTYCVYVLTEEVAGLKRCVCRNNHKRSLQLPRRTHSKLPQDHQPHLQTLSRGLELFAAVLMVLWVAMTVTTSLYFHSLPEKVIGGVIAFLAWLLTYGWLFGQASMPPKPHQNVISA